MKRISSTSHPTRPKASSLAAGSISAFRSASTLRGWISARLGCKAGASQPHRLKLPGHHKGVLRMSVEKVETLIVGGGQAGLAMSEHLGNRGVPHLIVERHRIAERWRSERWDSLSPTVPLGMTGFRT